MKLEIIMDKTKQLEESTVKVLQSFIDKEVKPTMKSHGVPENFVLKAVLEDTLSCVQLGLCEETDAIAEGEYIKLIILEDKDTGDKYVAMITEFFGYNIILSIVDLEGVEQNSRDINDVEIQLRNLIGEAWDEDLTGEFINVDTKN